MTVAVVILNWNGKKMLQRFLPEIVLHSTEASIYVIDNNSSDDSIAFIKNEFPNVKRVVNPDNLGYAGGYNLGLKGIKEDILCLINNDVRVTKNWLPPIIDFFKSNPNTQAAQPHILDENQPTKFEYAGAAGGYIDRFGYPFCRGRIFDTLEEDKGQYDGNEAVFWASGACLFIRNKLFNELEGFDEDFFMHQEEIDLCWRIRNFGGTTYSIGGSKVYHLGGASLPNSPLKVFYNYRNSLYMLLKNIPSIQLPLIFIIRLLLDGIAGLRFLLKGEFKNCFNILKAHVNVYVNLFKIIKKRRKINSKNPYYSLNSIVFNYFILKKSKISEIRLSKS